MKQSLRRYLVVGTGLVAAGAAPTAWAGGFQLNEQSVSGQGTGYAGRSSNVSDATILNGNPAGITHLDRPVITVGGTYIDAHTSISDSQGSLNLNGRPIQPTQGSAGRNPVPGTMVPFGFFTTPIDDHWAAGLGVYSPFGLQTDYGNDFKGRYFGDFTSVKVITVQPTIAYKFNEQWSVGVGVTYNHIDGEVRAFSPDASGLAGMAGLPGASPMGEGRVNVQGDDDAWGVNLGVMYRPTTTTTLGLKWRSKVSYHLKGDVYYSNVPGQGQPAAGNPLGVGSIRRDGKLNVGTPELFDFSVTQLITDDWRVMAGVTWVHWSEFRDINVYSDGAPNIKEDQFYKNSWQFALGTAYQLNSDWVVRGGFSYDRTPSRDAYRSVRIPSDDRYAISVGAGWQPDEHWKLDVAYSFLYEPHTDIDQSRDFGSGVSADYSARYHNKAHAFGAQLSYLF
ncbi:OmpP1/FadL family transporter [Carnimonas bestiolae]|uniref:OmpP1/FadL family transporter n=1 Tax=Carnimonas bestiolae TaxID=3402172 RepID=UPI003EDBF470